MTSETGRGLGFYPYKCLFSQYCPGETKMWDIAGDRFDSLTMMLDIGKNAYLFCSFAWIVLMVIDS